MDRRQTSPEESGFVKDLKEEDDSGYDDHVVYNGKSYRVPYRTVREIKITGVSKEQLRDIEHSARLQYRLLLLDSVLKAKVEFIRGTIIITYNPEDSKNRKEKISLEELIAFLSKEGVSVDKGNITSRDVDYIEEIYKYQFEPESIREHAPYGYSLEEWKRMKPEWERNSAKAKSEKVEKFKNWQDEYLEQHPELAAEYNYTPKPKKASMMDRLLGNKGGKKEKDKGFWFHGA